MRRLYLFALALWLLTGPLAGAQPAIVRTLTAPGFGTATRVVPTPDGGWALFAPDSLKLAKFDACGRPEWARRYPAADVATIAGLYAVTGLRGGGFAFMTRVDAGTTTATLVTRLDAAGNVVWSNVYSYPDYSQYPYTLVQDGQGDLVLFANVEHASLSPLYNMLCRISTATGAVQWARFYDLGGIWGGALPTTDGGVLARTGNRFIKTAADGAIQWVSSILTRSAQTYYAPVEMGDGYLFAGHAYPSQIITYYKIDRQGRLRWRTGKTTPYWGQLPMLRPYGNGRLVGVFNNSVGSRSYPTVVTFDADLNVVRQRSLNVRENGLDLLATDLTLTPTGAAVVLGRAAPHMPDALFMARTDSLLNLPCDTVLAAPVFRADSIIQEFITTTSSLVSLTVRAQAARVSPFTLGAVAGVCTALPALELGADTALCPGTTLLLRNRHGDTFTDYHWSTGATTPTLRVQQPGTYWLRASTACGLDTLTDSVTVAMLPLPAPAPATDTLLCTNASVVLDAQVAGPATYRWADGSTSPRYVAADTGRYTVEINLLAGCTRRFTYHVGECELLVMPNVFTPTGDARNERLVPITMRGIGAATLEVYTRWGRLVHTTADLRLTGWDGAGASAGTYFWVVRYTTRRGQPKLAKGWVEVIR